MKKLIVLLSVFPISAFASGKLLLEGAHKFNQERYHAHVASMGVATYEKMVGSVYHTTYVGAGMQDEVTGATQEYWAAAKVGLVIGFGELSIEPGFNVKYLTDNNGRFNNDVHVKLSYKIW